MSLHLRARLRAKEGFKTVVVKCGLIVGLDMVVHGAVSIELSIVIVVIHQILQCSMAIFIKRSLQ